MMFQFYYLNKHISQYLENDERYAVARAFLLGADAHENQTRSSGEPYFTHPVAVACMLAEMRLDKETIISALLHDVVEDTPITSEKIAEHFGENVATLVEGVTKLAKIKFQSKAEEQAENFRKMMLAMVNDIRVIIIKLADRLHNMSTLGPLSQSKKRRIALETLEIYAPIAHRLGMHRFKNEFEDHAFKALYPLRYRILQSRVIEARGHRKRLFEKIKSSLISHLQKENVPPERIYGREKPLYSIYRKMKQKHIPFSEIMDVYAFRIIANSVRQCYLLLGETHQLYKPIPETFNDYIAMPKSNGYQSLHTTVFGPYGIPIEIQIRTEEMNYTAERGVAAHWIYKSHELSSQKAQSWLNKLSDIQSRSESSMEFIENVKVDIFPDEVYVFTPKGNIVELPKGATAVDFAYRIHTDIGNHCIAARANQRLVPLNQKLHHGETVEVVTSPTAAPSPSWLDFVITHKAKHAIKQYIKEQKDQQAIRLGERLINQLLKQYQLTCDQLANNECQYLCQHFRVNGWFKLIAKVGRGEIAPFNVVNEIMHKRCHSDIDNTIENNAEDTAHEAIDISQTDQLITFDSSCNPIPGDTIIGVLTSHQGLQIHTTKCSKIQYNKKLSKNPEQFVHVKWPIHSQKYYKCQIMVIVSNTKGAIADIAQQITLREASINQIHVQKVYESDGLIAITLEIQDRVHLARVIKSIKRLNSVYKVYRFFDDEKTQG